MPAAVQALTSPRLLLIGLEEQIASELVRHLPPCIWSIEPDDALFHKAHLDLTAIDIIFCRAGHKFLARILKSAHAQSVPVVVVTAHPDVEEWLNAMDAGASDYTAPPFDRQQMTWLLNTNLKPYGATISVNSNASTAKHAWQTSAPSVST
jgi:DNA-binding NtrC family response regulator